MTVVAAIGPALGDLIRSVVSILSLLVVVYVLLDWGRAFMASFPDPLRRVHDGLGQLCEPLFAPVRSVLPAMGGIDFSPLITLIAIQLLGNFVATLVS